jgi:Glycosyltransferase 61
MQSPVDRISYLWRRTLRSLRRQVTAVGGVRLLRLQRQLAAGRGLASRLTSVQSEALQRLGVRFEVLGRSRPPSHLSPLRLPDDSGPEAKGIRPDLDYPPDATGPFGLITIPHARLCIPSSIVLVDRWLLEESMLNGGVLINPKYWWQAQTATLRAAKPLSPGVLGSLPWHHNFCHWMTEIFPRLRMLEDGHVDSSLPIYMPQSSPSFVKQSLDLVGLSGRVRWLPDGVYDAEGLIIPSRVSCGRPTSVAIDWLRERMLPESIAGESFSTPRYLYISRRDVADRVPSNEEQIASAMSSLGFEVVNFSKMDLAAQIRLTSRARLLVGAHGAGFAHVAFLPEGAGMIELTEEGHGIIGGGFQYLASLVNAQYGLLVYRNGLVDVPRLVRFVRQMVEDLESGRRLSNPRPGYCDSAAQKLAGSPRPSSTQA